MAEAAPPDPDFEALLHYIKRNRGFDFTGYKRSSLQRRVAVRMAALGVDGYAGYLDLLQVDADEFTHLFNAILVNVTGFFRDPAAWEYVGDEIVPKLLAEKSPAEPIRVWSAGCATGQEAYSLAMLLAERIGPEQLRDRVKIYGTDVDDDALAAARQATYSAKEIAGVPDGLVPRYFDRAGSRYAFKGDLRRAVIFGRHDLVQAAPISHIDLLVCRNTLMYLNAETQAKVLARLHFALEDHGALFLGKAEMLLTHAHLFVPIDLRRRVFAKVPKESTRERLGVIAEGGSHDTLEYAPDYRRLRSAAADASPTAQLVVHHNGTLAMVNAAARALFDLSLSDVGRPFSDLEVSYRPAELRSAVERVRAEHSPVVLAHVAWTRAAGEPQYYDVHLTPLADDGVNAATAISFIDVTTSTRLHIELEHANRELETAYEELQTTNEELETTNEELQSTIEELETTNEALQSTNEELETMNAELQSTNEELQTINDELRMRTTELDELNDFLESMLGSQPGGMIVVDPDLRVTLWNQGAAELWGLRPDEVPGQHLLNLDIGLPVEELRPALRAVLSAGSDHERLELRATNRRGRDFTCRVVLSPLRAKDGSVRGCILAMDDDARPRNG